MSIQSFPFVRSTAALLAAAGLSAVAAVATPAPAAAQEVGEVSRLSGRAAIVRSGRRGPAATEQPVFFQDRAETGAASRLALALIDGSEVTLGENASVVVDRFLFDPAAGQGAITLSTTGAFLFKGGEIDDVDGAELVIETPFAIIGVRGTEVWGGPIDGGYGVFLSEGEVSVTAGGATHSLSTPGEGVQIDLSSGTADAVRVWGRAKVDRALGAVFFAPEDQE